LLKNSAEARPCNKGTASAGPKYAHFKDPGFSPCFARPAIHAESAAFFSKLFSLAEKTSLKNLGL
jgi:hypothetical protein